MFFLSIRFRVATFVDNNNNDNRFEFRTPISCTANVLDVQRVAESFVLRQHGW